MALTQKEILDGIDHLSIYKKDYDNILMLLNNNDDKLFTKILEEVLEGNLFWSDVDQLLSTTDYQDILNDQLELQEKLSKEMSLLAEFRAKIRQTLKKDEYTDKNIVCSIGPFYDNKSTQLGLTRGDPNLVQTEEDQKNIDIYDKEYEAIRDTIVFELTKPNDKDNALSLAFKNKLENAIRNGEILLKKVNDGENIDYNEKYIFGNNYSQITVESDTNPQLEGLYEENISEGGYKLTADTSVQEGKSYYERESFDYINPDDIFFYITNYIIPLDYKHQVLVDVDRDYMKKNNLTEEQMKQFKSLAAFYRRDMFYLDTGGENVNS